MVSSVDWIIDGWRDQSTIPGCGICGFTGRCYASGAKAVRRVSRKVIEDATRISSLGSLRCSI